MTIYMYCDNCGKEIDHEVAGSSRLRTGKKEIAFHLCEKHQAELKKLVVDFCVKGTPRDVQPSLKKD